VKGTLTIAASLVVLAVHAAPAAGDSLRLERVTEDGVRGARLVYIGDERDNFVEIGLARNEDLDYEAPDPRKVIGFLVTDAAPSAACEATGSEGEQVCRVPDRTRLLAPRVYLGAGKDVVYIEVPRRDAIVYGGPGPDVLDGPYRADGDTLLPAEFHGGPGNDDITATGLVYGGPGNDEMTNTSSPSRLVAGSGDDQIWGSEGDDVINAGAGHDTVVDWGGNDVIRTRDGQTDTVGCGDGRRDRLTADVRDESDVDSTQRGPFDDCERLDRRGEPLLTPFRFQGWDYEPYVTVLYGCPPDGPSLCLGTCSLRRGGRLIARRPLRERAGTWGVVYFRLGSRRINRLLDKDIRITIRWRDRTGHMRSLAKRIAFTSPRTTTTDRARMREKRCPKCGEIKPVDEFPIRRASADDRSYWCRACHAVAKREYRHRHGDRLNAARRREPIPPRICRTCGQTYLPVRRDQNYCRPWCREHKYLTRLESESR
jgi:hypothetical protein